MCDAFSGIIERNLKTHWKLGMDRHSEIEEMAGLKDDKWPDAQSAKFEIILQNGDYYKPDKWVFILDEDRKPTWWSSRHEAACWRAHKEWKEELYAILDTKTEILNPLTQIKPPKKVLEKHIRWLKEWNSVEYSVWNSVRNSVRNSVGYLVWNSVEYSVWNLVGNSVEYSVGNSVEYSVWNSVWNSVGYLVYAQIGTLFKLKKWEHVGKSQGYPFQPAVNLWNEGLVPSFDGETWRLHAGPKAEVVFEIGEKELVES